MATNWYLIRDGRQTRPYSADAVCAMACSGTPSAGVRRQFVDAGWIPNVDLRPTDPPLHGESFGRPAPLTRRRITVKRRIVAAFTQLILTAVIVAAFIYICR